MILNTLGIVLILFLIKILSWILLKLYAKVCKSKKVNKFADSMGKSMFFSELIGLYLQGFFEFLIAAILTMKKKEHALAGELLSLIITYFSFFVQLIFLPLASLYIIY